MIPYELCDYCQKDGALARCSKCKCAYYCNVDCQKKHWKLHKTDCQHLQNECKERNEMNNELTHYLANYDRLTSQECGICVEIVESHEKLILPCEHVFCFPCLQKLYYKSLDFYCPICEKEFHLLEDSYTLMKKFINRAEIGHDQDKRTECLYYASYAADEYERLKCLRQSLICEDDEYQPEEQLASNISLQLAELKISYFLEKYDECVSLGSSLLSLPMVDDTLPLYIIIVLPYVDAKSRLGLHQECYTILMNTYKKMEQRIGELLSDDTSSGEEMVEINARVIRECYYLGNYNEAIFLGEESLTAPIGYRTESADRKSVV